MNVQEVFGHVSRLSQQERTALAALMLQYLWDSNGETFWDFWLYNEQRDNLPAPLIDTLSYGYERVAFLTIASKIVTMLYQDAVLDMF